MELLLERELDDEKQVEGEGTQVSDQRPQISLLVGDRIDMIVAGSVRSCSSSDSCTQAELSFSSPSSSSSLLHLYQHFLPSSSPDSHSGSLFSLLTRSRTPAVASVILLLVAWQYLKRRKKIKEQEEILKVIEAAARRKNRKREEGEEEEEVEDDLFTRAPSIPTDFDTQALLADFESWRREQKEREQQRHQPSGLDPSMGRSSRRGPASSLFDSALRTDPALSSLRFQTRGQRAQQQPPTAVRSGPTAGDLLDQMRVEEEQEDAYEEEEPLCYDRTYPVDDIDPSMLLDEEEEEFQAGAEGGAERVEMPDSQEEPYMHSQADMQPDRPFSDDEDEQEGADEPSLRFRTASLRTNQQAATSLE
jgi:hypothetical protein